MECKPCGKTFTGEVCYQQHLESEKHKKKVLLNLRSQSQNSSNNSIPIGQQPKLLQCTVCDVIFGSLEDFQSHSLSPEHAKNIISKTEDNGINNNTISSSSSEDQAMPSSGDENKPLPESDIILSDFDNKRMYQAYQYTQCEVCKKSFSGPEPYKQHMDSELHKKKVDLQKNYPLGSDANQSMSSLFTCEQCKKFFSGQIPYMQHMTSDTHKKKLQHLEALKRFSALMGSESKQPDAGSAVDHNLLQPADTNPFFCKLCNTQCSGIAPYEQHLRGSSHLKNVSKAQLQNWIYKSAEPTMSVLPEDSSSKPNSDVCDGQRGSITTINQGQENDYVLPELADKLRVMSTNELQDCVKMFEPDDPIDFDQLEAGKQMQNGHDDASGEKQIEIKENGVVPENTLNETANTESKVFTMCDLCNVPLLSMKDALCHFESPEHFNRKWRSE